MNKEGAERDEQDDDGGNEEGVHAPQDIVGRREVECADVDPEEPGERALAAVAEVVGESGDQSRRGDDGRNQADDAAAPATDQRRRLCPYGFRHGARRG
jgi:hypothetical protein